jgi:hypothetical protein
MKTGIITFHASHNYGSMLQAYALQQTVLSLGHECEIINFRTLRQKTFYRPFYRQNLLRSKVKALLYPRLAINDKRKWRLFERFMKENYHLTAAEYATFDQLRDAQLGYDAIICGSDQIWNTTCFDHDPAFFLGFTDNAKKIAYAPSMGPVPESAIEHRFDNDIRDALESFSHISVRESATADRIEAITAKRPPVVLDPTLLLTPDEWDALVPAKRTHPKDYIFFYSPSYDDSALEATIKLAEQWGIDIIVSQSNISKHRRRNKRIKFKTAIGPVEFLSLIKNAQLVMGTSFHAVVFSILFARPFYAVGGMEDARISTLLSATGLQQFAKLPEELNDTKATAAILAGRQRLEPLRQASLQFLRTALTE